MVKLFRKSNRHDEHEGKLPRWKRSLHVTRRVLTVALFILMGALLVVTAVFLIPPTRGALLGWSVRFADDALPGRLTVGEADWPSLGHLILKDVLWVSGSATAPGDTLADLARLDLTLDLGALREREGRIDSLLLDVRQVDVPGLSLTMEDMAEESQTDSRTAEVEIPYFKPGSLPGIPAVTVARFDLKVARTRLAPGMDVRDLVLEGRAEANADGPAAVVIDHAAARFLTALGDTTDAPVWEVALKHLGLGLTLAFPAGDDWTLVTADLDSLNLEFAPTPNQTLRESWQAPSPVSLGVVFGIERNGPEYSGRLACDFVLPGSAHFQPWLPRDFPHQEFESISGHLVAEGKFSDPLAKGTLRLDLGANSWVEKGVIAGGLEADVDAFMAHGIKALTARLDTLDIALKGISVTASGEWGAEDAGLDMAVALTDLHLPGLFASQVNPALAEVWRDPGPVSLDAAARLEKSGNAFTGSLDCDFLLPGSSHFHTWLPEDFPHEEFDSLSGTLAVTGGYAAPITHGALHLDLGSNSWMENGVIAGSASADIDSLMVHGIRELTARLDTLDIAMTGIRVNASGGLEPDSVELELVGDLTDFQLLGLFAGPGMAEAELDLQVDAAIAGSLGDPEVDAHLEGGFHNDGIAIPSFDFNLEGDRTDVAASLRAGGGLEFEGTRLDSVRAEVSGEYAGLDSLKADFALAVWQPDRYLAVGGSVQGDSVRVVELDSLVMTSYGRRMRTSGPVTLTLGPGPSDFELTKLEFVGDPGSVVAQGFWNEEGMDFSAGIDLLLKEDLLQLVVPLPLWSLNGGSDLKLDVTAGMEGSDENPEVVGQARAVLLPHREDPPFGIALNFLSRGGADAHLKADFSLTSADTVLLEAKLDWPGKGGPEAGFWNPDPGRAMVLTVPSQKLDMERINRRLPDQMVLDGEFDIAAEVHLFPPGKGKDQADSLSESPLSGTVEASLGTPDLRIDLPNRSWIETVVGATVTGSLADPKVAGKLEITSGFIRIPELPRNLHAVEGQSLLWSLRDSIAAAMDSTVTDSVTTAAVGAADDSLVIFLVPAQMGPALDPSQPPALPELDFEVVLTDDLRIIGYGADIKLVGGIRIARGYDEDKFPGPSITGDIRVREGTLKVMNRVFDVQRGNIHFSKAVPPNPNLDLMLETQVGTYLVRILISGKADDPVIDLTSEPDLTEEDIMAVLLFGQPLNDLDNDQRGRMQEENDPSQELQKNLAGLAMSFGAKGLQDSMGDSFGVDMVQMGSDSEGGSTLMVGKFITPDIMLKYHQSLEKSGTYFMTLEYSLNRYFKVITIYGQGEEDSGAELQWSKRY